MLPVLLAFPVILTLTLIQVGVISRLPLLYGTGDVVLLAVTAWALHERVDAAWFWSILAGVVVSLVSALPFFIPLWGYLIVTAIARVLRQRVWQTPLLAMLLVTFTGSMIMLGLSWGVLQFQTRAYPLLTSLNLIIMPSALLNLLLAVPIYAIMNDLADFLYPEKMEL